MAIRLSAPSAGRPLPPGRVLVLVSVRGWVDPVATVQLEGLGQLKKIQWPHRESIQIVTLEISSNKSTRLSFRLRFEKVRCLVLSFFSSLSPISHCDLFSFRINLKLCTLQTAGKAPSTGERKVARHLHTQDNINTQKRQRYFYDSGGIQAGEDISYIRQRGHCDQRFCF
jgi:hypothetical protein